MDDSSKKTLFIALIGIGTFPFLVNGYINSVLYTIPIAYWSFEVLSWILIPIIVLTIAIKYGGLKASQLGLSFEVCGKKNIPLLIFLCILFCPIDYYLYTELYKVFSELFPAESFFEYESVVPKDGYMRVVVAIYFGLSAGIVEEFYYRGFFYRTAQFFSHPTAVYVIASPLIFSVVHWEGGTANLLTTYIFGLLAVFAFLYIRNLWPFIIGHIFTDSVWFN